MKYIVENGVLPERDMLMLAPYGYDMSRGQHFYVYLGAYTYMFVHNFLPNLELWQYLIYFPAFLGSLMAIPMYFIGKILYDKKAGLFAAFLIVMSSQTVSRSLGGDPDSDAIVMLMPLVVMALFLYTYKNLDKKTVTKKNIFWSFLTGLSMTLFAYTWVGYWFVPLLVLGLVFVRASIDLIVKRGNVKTFIEEHKPIFFSVFIAFLTFYLLTVPYFGLNFMFDISSQPIEMSGFFGRGLKAEEGLYPNVYVSVQELIVGGSVKHVIQRTGIHYFILTLFSFMYLFFHFLSKNKHLDTIILLILWISGPLYASTVAVRFTTLLTPPFILGSSIVLSKVWRFLLNEDSKLLD
jgi:asparagine N-glycosylation enzyme membrane subunit Stt3